MALFMIFKGFIL